ncbi:MAG: 2-phospho-L-lactate transferase [Actinomycetota bacterium]|nr:2-phospho-L-lactate transferase [Actinomycetota bacterium]
MEVTAIAGGVGGAKLLVGLQRVLGSSLSAIVNTADDAVIYGVHVSPDLDTCTYWLAGIADTARGWGLEGDTFEVVEGMRALGLEAWFNLGDRDFATCLHRTGQLAAGATLAEVTADLTDRLGIAARLLPMSNDEVRTRVATTDERTLDFQEYFVKERTLPEVAEIRFAGIADAAPAPGVLDAIDGAEVIVVCPSNPIVSTGPILGLPGVRDALRTHKRVLAVSPIIQGAALKGPADRMMTALGSDATARGVAHLYADFVDVFVLDSSDADQIDSIEQLGVSAAGLDTIMSDHDASERLARELLGL